MAQVVLRVTPAFPALTQAEHKAQHCTSVLDDRVIAVFQDPQVATETRDFQDHEVPRATLVFLETLEKWEPLVRPACEDL